MTNCKYKTGFKSDTLCRIVDTQRSLFFKGIDYALMYEVLG